MDCNDPENQLLKLNWEYGLTGSMAGEDMADFLK